MAIYCGIDIAKDSFHATAIDPEGRRLWARGFRMSRGDFDALLRLLGPAGEVQVGMESTGIYFRPLSHFLQQAGHRVWEINPLLIHRFVAETTLRKTKTDRRDSETIALFLRVKISSLRPPVPWSDFQDRSRARETFQKEITRFKNNLKRLLSLSFPEILGLIHPFSGSGLELLLRYPSAAAIRAAATIDLPRRKGRVTAERLRQAADHSIGISSPAQDDIIRSVIRALQALQAELESHMTALRETAEVVVPDSLARLRSIPGVGEITALHFLAETHGRAFASAKSIIAYAGLDPAIEQSGMTTKRGKITKRGNRSLRRVLFLMAQSAVQRNPSMAEYYRRKREQGKAYRQAILCVAHKLVRLIFALLTQQELYQPAES